MVPETVLKDRHHSCIAELFQTVALAVSVSALFYFIYYLLAPWIWSRNIPFNPADITPWILAWTKEQDGVEIYALYILMFINSAAALLINRLIGHSNGIVIKSIFAVVCITVSIIYCAAIGFNPPMNTVQSSPLLDTLLKSLTLMAIVYALIALLHYMGRCSSRLTVAMVALLLVPVCFIATEPIAWLDYTYIFSPALRFLYGAPISDIYFQYDLLPSLLAAVWMKLGMDLNTFQVLGQASYFATILLIFVLSRNLFLNKGLSLFLVTALVLGRIYASPWDVVLCFQVTSLRLDLWLPLVLAVYYRGPYHWSAGLVCGLLILLLKNFGIIYSLAYLQLLITLSAIDYYDSDRRSPLPGNLIAYGKRCSLPVMIIVFFGIVSYFIFKNDIYGSYSGYYQKIGIGFMKIATNSFYWYVLPVLSSVIILLFRLRSHVSAAYLAAGFLLAFCAIGNSIYFFGRSHEHNILNISIVLLFLFFLMLDLFSRYLNKGSDKAVSPSFLRRNSANFIAVVLIAVIIVSYAQVIVRKSGTQIRNAGKAQLIYPLGFDFRSLQDYLNVIRAATGNSNKVYFVDNSDFALYYYGGYAPVGYCNPFQTWIFTQDLNRFLQRLLDNGYYLVFSPELKYLLVNVRFDYVNIAGETVVVSGINRQVPKP